MKVEYCEYLMFQQPKRIEMEIEKAIDRFNSKRKALSNHPSLEAGSFVGIKHLDKDKWIMTNDDTMNDDLEIHGG